jgi:nucleotide-binding universal stress UspA family protein
MSTIAGRILVGVDGSANSAAALRWAVGEADVRRHRVVALFAWGYIPPGHAGDGRTFDAEYTAANAEAALAATVEAALGAEAAGRVERRVRRELPLKALLATAADQLVIGARGVGGFHGLMLGSVSEACLHHTSVPLAIIRTAAADGAVRGEERVPGPAAGGRIVVGVDGSDSARRALHWALDEGRRRAASVDVVHAWKPPYVVPSPFAGLPLDVDVIEKHARATLDREVDAEDTRRQPAPVGRILVRGGAARAVLDTATGADLVVLGTRGLDGFRGLVLGSVTHHVAHHVQCPLVVIP